VQLSAIEAIAEKYSKAITYQGNTSLRCLALWAKDVDFLECRRLKKATVEGMMLKRNTYKPPYTLNCCRSCGARILMVFYIPRLARILY